MSWVHRQILPLVLLRSSLAGHVCSPPWHHTLFCAGRHAHVMTRTAAVVPAKQSGRVCGITQDHATCAEPCPWLLLVLTCSGRQSSEVCRSRQPVSHCHLPVFVPQTSAHLATLPDRRQAKADKVAAITALNHASQEVMRRPRSTIDQISDARFDQTLASLLTPSPHLQVEAERWQAEADKVAAITALEHASWESMQQQAEKFALIKRSPLCSCSHLDCRWRLSGGRQRPIRWQPSRPWSVPLGSSCARRLRSAL